MLEKYCDQATLELINKMLKVGYVDIHNLNDRAKYQAQGTPQGSILSPLLSNIYLNHLDQFMEKTLLPK